MKRDFKHWVIFLAVVFTIWLIAETASAEKNLTYVGKVLSIRRGTLSVKGKGGKVMYFPVGRRTVYSPRRLPAIGERVKVSYFLRRGHHVAYQVEMLHPPSKKK